MGRYSLSGHDEADRDDRSTVVAGQALVAHVEHYDRAPDECTLFPEGLDDEDLVTHWVSAEEGSYVSLAAMR